MQRSARGETPITKNILVTDEYGRSYEATYPKRAKGLVKSGRARFIDDCTICLACPPNTNSEDEIMENNNISVVEKTTAEQTPENPVLTMEYILTRIDRIIEDTGHIRSALESLNTSGDDVTGQARAEAIKSTVQCRETTNQQLIRLLEKMYEDMPHRDSLREKALTIVERAMIDTTLESDAQETLSTLLDTVRHIGH